MNLFKQTTLFICLFFLIGCVNFKAESNQFDIKKVDFDNQTYPVVICGGGPGGLTAAIYLAQANIKSLVLEGPNPGGAITMSHSIRNWPGEIDIPGKKLMEKIKEQAIKNGAEIVPQIVTQVNFSTWPYLITVKDLNTGQTSQIKALSTIIAIGTKPNYLNVPGEQEYWGKGISNCATCDGPLYKNKTVAIVGGGDAAISEANYLARIAQKVLILVRSNKLRAKEKFAQEVTKLSNVEILYNTQIKEILGDKKGIKNLLTFNNKTNEEKLLEIDGLFLAIGSTPNTQIFQKQLELDSKGFIILKKDQQTSLKGIFALGDIADPKYKQAISAAGDGCKAALQTQRFLEKIGYQINLQKTEEKKEILPEEKHTVLEISGNKFTKTVLESSTPVVVDFFATWCFPCQRMAPIFENLAQDFKGKIKFVKINIDNNNSLANQFGIQSVPTFLFIKNGKEIKRLVGGKDFEAMKQIISQTFGASE